MNPLLQLLMIFRLFLAEIVLSLVLGIAAITAGIGLLGTSAFIIASAALHPSIAVLQVAIVGVRFFGISRGVFRYLERLISHSVNLRVVSRLREDFIRRVEPGAPANLVTRQGGDILQTVMGDLQILENFYVRVISPVVVALVIMIGTSLFVGKYTQELGLILFSGMLITGFMLPTLGVKLTAHPSASLAEANAIASAKLVEVLQGLEDIQSTNTQQGFIDRLQRVFEKAGKQQIKLSLIAGLNNGVSLLLTNLTLLVILWVAIPSVNQGTISGVSLAVITLVVLAAFEAVAPMNVAAQTYNAALSAAQRLYSIGDPELPPTDAKKIPLLISAKKIEFDNVSFSYQTGEAEVVEDFTFELKPGTRTAIVGASGAGKTSILNLLLAFQRPSSGRILLDGLDYQLFESDDIRKLFSVLMQNNHLFNDDIRQNLLLANPYATDEDLHQAISSSGLGGWLESQQEGLDTWIGERGVKLSGGQRQRLALTRLYLQNRPYVLLDEPTANLDQVTAAEVMTNIFLWAADKGMIIISHELRWLHSMDEILLIDAGKVIERGGFTELMAMKGRFTRLYEAEKEHLVEG